MVTPKPSSVVVADGKCPLCGSEKGVLLKANRKGHLYIYCPHEADGGCRNSSMSRSDSGDLHYARNHAKKWRKPEYRKAYLGNIPDRTPAPAPAPAPAPEPDPDPEPEPEPADPEADARKALFG